MLKKIFFRVAQQRSETTPAGKSTDEPEKCGKLSSTSRDRDSTDHEGIGDWLEKRL